MRVCCEIYKAVAGAESRGGFVEYIVEAEPSDTVLDVLVSIYQAHDPTLSFRYACGVARCGECAMRINGEPCMACDRIVEPRLRIEPLEHLPLIKDMVIDRRHVFAHIRRVLPPAAEIHDIPAHFQAMEQQEAHRRIEHSIRLTTCFECLICQSNCPRYLADSDAFPGPLGLLMLAQMRENPAQEPLDPAEVDRLAAGCLRCGRCVRSCPALEKPLDFGLDLLGAAPEPGVRVCVGAGKGLVVRREAT